MGWLRGLKVVLAMAAMNGWARTYTTNFPLTESVLSEGGNWINSAPPISTGNGLAYGTQTGVEPQPPYNDPVAILAGSWGPDQSTWGTVHTVNQQGGNVYEEVELSLRMIITPTVVRGYNIDFKCSHDGTQYVEIGYWIGAPGDVIRDNPAFLPLAKLYRWEDPASINNPGLSNGDLIKATAIGDIISIYVNGVRILQYNDTDPAHYHTGAPGFGFYLHGASGVNKDYGFTSFTATDEVTANAVKSGTISTRARTTRPQSRKRVYNLLGQNQINLASPQIVDFRNRPSAQAEKELPFLFVAGE